MAALSSSGAARGGSEREKPRATTVSVDDYETWVEAKRYTVYKIVVRLPGKAFFIFRRSVFNMA